MCMYFHGFVKMSSHQPGWHIEGHSLGHIRFLAALQTASMNDGDDPYFDKETRAQFH